MTRERGEPFSNSGRSDSLHTRARAFDPRLVFFVLFFILLSYFFLLASLPLFYRLSFLHDSILCSHCFILTRKHMLPTEKDTKPTAVLIAHSHNCITCSGRSTLRLGLSTTRPSILSTVMYGPQGGERVKVTKWEVGLALVGPS